MIAEILVVAVEARDGQNLFSILVSTVPGI